jgi:hypothetical protein
MTKLIAGESKISFINRCMSEMINLDEKNLEKNCNHEWARHNLEEITNTADAKLAKLRLDSYAKGINYKPE